MFDDFYNDVLNHKESHKDIKLDLIDRDKIAKYIMCTKHHFDETTYDDSDLNYVLDFDLWEFSNEDFDKYMVYSRRIYFEFSHFSEAKLRHGRTQFFEKVLKKSYIFRHEEFFNK